MLVSLRCDVGAAPVMPPRPNCQPQEGKHAREPQLRSKAPLPVPPEWILSGLQRLPEDAVGKATATVAGRTAAAWQWQPLCRNSSLGWDVAPVKENQVPLAFNLLTPPKLSEAKLPPGPGEDGTAGVNQALLPWHKQEAGQRLALHPPPGCREELCRWCSISKLLPLEC